MANTCLASDQIKFPKVKITQTVLAAQFFETNLRGDFDRLFSERKKKHPEIFI